MQFSKLRLVGFKSFVEPMEFFIEGGLTGVVGPNGCGKSNLVEALRWVMGENSYKNMRASGMDDVIFSGNNTRPPRNFAEVTLYLDNSDHSAPSGFNDADELQVSRRIERGAGSTYRVNGKEVRAKDVQLLFADQSTGARSPSMVGQGRVGELIQAKPQARRALLEEAAGISGLHSRRHEAELRLRAAETNLERLDDVVADVSSRIESLKRQARQANRFKTLSAEIRQLEAGLFYLRWSQAKSQEAEMEAALTKATLKVGSEAEAQMRFAREQAENKTLLAPLRDNMAKARAGHQRITLEVQALEDEKSRSLHRQSELMRRIEQLQRDVIREKGLIAEYKQFINRLDSEEQELKDIQSDGSAEEEELRTQYEDLQSVTQNKEADLAKLNTERAELNAGEQQLQRLLSDLGRRRDKLNQDLQALASSIAALEKETESQQQADELNEALEAIVEQLYSLEEQLPQIEDEIGVKRNNYDQCRKTHDELKRQLSGFEAEARTLEQIIAASSLNGGDTVVEHLSVEKGYESALGAALGDDLQAALDEDALLFWRDLKFSGADPHLPIGCEPLADYIKAPDNMMRRLKQIGLVKADEGDGLQRDLQLGQVLVSREGACWRWDGLVAKADAPTASAQRLAQKNRLAEVQEFILKSHQQGERAKSDEAIAYQQLQELLSQEKECRAALRQMRDSHSQKQTALKELEISLNARLSRLNHLQENYQRLELELEENAVLNEEAAIKLEELASLDELDAKIAALHALLQNERAMLAQLRSSLETWQRDNLQRQRRLEAIAPERKTWQARLSASNQQFADLQERVSEAMMEMEDLASAPDDFDERRDKLFQLIAKAEDEVKSVSDALALAENTQNRLDLQATNAIQALSHAREERARNEERFNAAIDRRKDIETRIWETLNVEPIETLKMAGFNPSDTMPDIADLERDLDRARIERERLGAVNLRAEEESSELQERYASMTVERDDVIEAVKKLRQAIHALNREGRERLLAAFTKVNSEFQRLFTHLFGGGTAELQLIESDDPLDAGLEILARPPGKKPQTMTLLSGGEQALTAMALIFAVFLTNPAPICVLDEIDAPLDDHNVERYCNLMDEMTKLTDTRFVIITHNPITMARMDRLFGVTMGEQGVSQLVSVDLRTAETLRDI
ncbi:chromosome segregation SMC family protein [Bartonella sp. HY406]|uniref:chromosome segregation SMC family protein n=1 Tax=Bartonella sp. HY406 TaxID=2979331 RepID=UPI0021C67338|nr:chromosome segregation SMC family protein [Bartonella sp. HY406]UXN02258.1 chromosome segregation protein SMC [Bartonella sp. HY406]